MNCEASSMPTFSISALLSLRERISKLKRLSLFGRSGFCKETTQDHLIIVHGLKLLWSIILVMSRNVYLAVKC